MVIFSFLFFMFSFLLVGAYSATRKRNTTEDYLLASRNVSPWLTALSAAATNNSGYMFIGLIGFTYSVGISSMWLMVGWISGDYLAWRFIHEKLRRRSQEKRCLTVPSFLGGGFTGGDRWVIRASAIITLLFLGFYAAAQLKAGSKALHVLFGWPDVVGAAIGALIVGLYCLYGGIRASIWTDALQSIIMLGSMSVLLFVTARHTGGLSGLFTSLAAIDPQLTDPVPRDLRFGFAIYLAGWVTAGIGVVGQPHVMVRAMAIDKAEHIGRARRIYVIWYSLFSASAIAVGLASRVLLSAPAGVDSELALPLLASELLPPALVGFVLAGLFASTISTADSQILSCSAALTQDLFPRWQHSYKMAKAGTVLVTASVLALAVLGTGSVFFLVVLAWSALGSALGPLLVVRALSWPVDAKTALGMILTGLACMLFWRYGLGWSAAIYEVLPGMAGGFFFYFSVRSGSLVRG